MSVTTVSGYTDQWMSVRAELRAYSRGDIVPKSYDVCHFVYMGPWGISACFGLIFSAMHSRCSSLFDPGLDRGPAESPCRALYKPLFRHKADVYHHVSGRSQTSPPTVPE